MKYTIFSPGKLKDYEKEILRDSGFERRYQKGQFLFKAGDDCSGIYLVEKGAVEVFRHQEGTGRRVIAIKRKGELLGMEDVLRGDKMTCTARAVRQLTLLAVKREDFLDLLAFNPFLLHRIIHISGLSGRYKKSGTRLSKFRVVVKMTKI